MPKRQGEAKPRGLATEGFLDRPLTLALCHFAVDCCKSLRAEPRGMRLCSWGMDMWQQVRDGPHRGKSAVQQPVCAGAGLLLICLWGCGSLLAQPRASLSPTRWDVGTVAAGATLTFEVRVTNAGSGELRLLDVRATCKCLKVTPKLDTRAGHLTLALALDTDRIGFEKFRYLVLLRTNDPQRPTISVPVEGRLRRTVGKRAAAVRDEGSVRPRSGSAKATLKLFYDPGCRSCRRVLRRLRRYVVENTDVVLIVRDLHDRGAYEELLRLEGAADLPARDPMVLFVNDASPLYGRSIQLPAVQQRIADAARQVAAIGDEAQRTSPATENDRTASADESITLGVILSAGLIDGINPCAFATIVFLVSLLAAVGRKGRDVLWIGGTFCAAVFLTYLLLGAGLLGAAARLRHSPIANGLIVSGACVLAFVFAAMSLHDIAAYRRQGVAGVLLQLPLSLKQRIHAALRSGLKFRRLVVGAFAAGVAVSLLESVCTGQMYLPALAFMVRQADTRAKAVAYLASYNAAFVLPLVVVLVACFVGVRADWLARAARQHFVLTKACTAAGFLLLAAALIVL